MNKIKTILSFAMLAFLASCYSDTVENFEKFNFQFPVNFATTYTFRAIPDTSRDFSNLYKYQEYYDNRDKIDKAIVLQFNYWIDTLVKADNTPYDPKVDKLEFDYVRYKLLFAKPKNGNIFSQDSTDFEPDPTIEPFVLGEYSNVKVEEFYRNPNHIIDVPLEVSNKISEFMKTKPYFYVVAEYSKLKGQTEEKIYFPYFKAKFDIIIRFEVKL